MLLPVIAVFAVLAAPLSTWNQAEVDAFLSQEAGADFETRLLHIAQAAEGTPYFDGPLGEGPGAPYDADPVYDLSRVDCVTFIEQCIALAASPDLVTAVNNLQKIRYKNGQVDFAARNHYFISDWMKNNIWCKNVSPELGVEMESATRTIDRAGLMRLNKADALAAQFQPERATVAYVPVGSVVDAEPKIPNASIIVFIGKKDGIFALHCGMYFREGNAGKLYHASSKAGKVIAMGLQEYLDTLPTRYAGIAVYKVTEPAL